MTWWDTFVNGLKDFFNQPVPIIGCTIGALLVFVLVVISKTSIGKKSLKKLQGGFDEVKKNYDDVKKLYSDVIKSKDEMIKSIKDEFAYKSAIILEEKKKTEQLIFDISEYIHNVNVEKVVNEYKEKAVDRIADVNEEVASVIETEKDNFKKEYQSGLDEINSLKLELEQEKKELETLKETILAEKDKIVKEGEEIADKVKDYGGQQEQ